MAFFDLSTLNDDELGQHKIDVLTEIENRDRMKQIPTQVADLSKAYREGGGDPDVLLEALAAD